MRAVVRPLEGTDLEGFDRLRTLLYPDRPETFDTDRYFSIWRWLELQHAAKLLNIAGLPALPTSIPPPITQLGNWGLRALDRAL
ncbi:MAG: hypothetical protein AVDCRST_MAG93-4002, partial [uncultured Chloroflexia bacterium]